MIVNIIRFKKTYINLLFFVIYAQSFFFFNIQSHRFVLCIASSDIILYQWQEIICKFFSLMLIIAYNERTIFRLSSNWVFVHRQIRKFANDPQSSRSRMLVDSRWFALIRLSTQLSDIIFWAQITTRRQLLRSRRSSKFVIWDFSIIQHFNFIKKQFYLRSNENN
jgi:hypothetical protein